MTDDDVRIALFALFAETGRAPSKAAVAERAGGSEGAVAGAYARLAEAHVIVLAPGGGDVWMANPFSAVPTPFDVTVGDRHYWGNCIWDALGVVSLLGGTGSVHTPCPCCGERLEVEVRDREPSGEGVVHFAVPASRWWANIAFT